MRLSGTFIDEIYYSKKDLLFRTRSGTDPKLIWYQTVRITDLARLEALSKVKDLDAVIRESGIKVHCFPGYTKVLTEEGYKEIDKIEVGEKVFTHLGRLQKVTRVFESYSDKLVEVKVGTSKFDLIKCTLNHKFLTKSGWVEANKLKAKDSLISPRLSVPETTRVPDKLAFILGLYLADGSLAPLAVLLYSSQSNEPSAYICI